MPSTDAFALQRSGLNEFLFAAIGTEGNGMRLSVLSVFARLGHDPWKDAGRLAGLPKLEASESLARTIAGMPTSIWPLPAAMEIASRLIALLHVQSAKPGLGSTVSAYRTKATRFVSIGVMLTCLRTGIFARMDAPMPRASDMTSFVASHP
jgi:hypothetical protein